MNLGSLVMSFRAFLRRFRKQQSGQDLAEYCLLTAFLALAAAAIFVYASGGIQSIWITANTTIAAGSTSSTGGGTASPANNGQ
jgi:Flp pilus assembly pilin Flp